MSRRTRILAYLAGGLLLAWGFATVLEAVHARHALRQDQTSHQQH